MTLYVTKVDRAQTEINFLYFDSEHVWGLSVSATYSFHINDVTGLDEDDTLQVGMEAIENAYARPNIAAKIGLDEFKNGNVTSINFGESRGVDRTTCSITIEERIRVDDDNVLSDLTDLIPSPQDIENFTESFEFKRGANSYSYSRNVSLSYKQDAGSQFLNKARIFLKNVYLNNRPSFGYQVDGISEYGRLDAGLKPNVSEEIDIINKTISFSETLDTARIENIGGLPFSKHLEYSINLNENGYTSKSYSIELKSLSEPFELNITSGIKLTIDQLIQENSGDYNLPVTIERGIVEDGNLASLSVVFTNDPRVNQEINIDYSASKGSSPEGFDNYSFDMSVSSRGKTDEVKFLQNKNYWRDNHDMFYTKIPALFTEVSSGDLNEVSRSVRFDPFSNRVSQTVNLTNDPQFEDQGDGILRRTVEISDTKQIQRDIVLPIYGDSEIVVTNVGKTLGQRVINVSMSAVDPSILVSGSLAYASGFAPDVSNYFLMRQTTNLNILKNDISTNLTYNYFDE